ncbi:kinase-like domain-containing protein [Aspergillus avenaceus]|uniref:non-specific serine/threonine protein kinase n=1 Tax=Aspergillus avenaceus TaxID=36643 RepID=A0A5N6TT80_ASPAV|nr:kinase-like domain-containing protein [Aspergillus avenaceus]
MADDGMSIIPYGSSNHDVVLRHNDSVVVFDRDSQQLVLRNTTENNADIDLTDCPYCHRPLHDANGGQERRHASGQPEFINPNYFRMLHKSLPSSSSSSASSSQRFLVQPALADGSPTEHGEEAPSPQGISSTAFTPNYFKKFFVEEGVLGKGGKGVVLLVKHTLDGVPLGHYACKRVPVGDDHEWLAKVLREVQLLQSLTHQNLVSYRHVWLENAKISTFGPSVPCAFILQQYCNAGDLHNYIYGSVQAPTTAQQLKERLRRKSKGEPDFRGSPAGPRKLHFDEIYSFFKDITSGLRYLHAKGFIHRDLKPSNCLLDETSDGIRVLVSDFGEVQAQDAMRLSTGATGTVSYCAPEVLRREFPGGPFGNFTFKSDIFSLGMVLYFLCFAQLPYRNADLIHEEREDLDRLREEISQWAGFDDARRMRPDLPQQLYTFLERLLSVNPDRRPSADDILNGLQVGASATESMRPRKAGASSPEVQASRIHPVDNAAPGHFSRSPTSPRKAFRSPVPLRPSPQYEADGGVPIPWVEDMDPSTERRLSLSPDRGMVLRSRYPSTPAISPLPNEPDEVQETREPVQHLLPPPPGGTFLTRISALFRLSDLQLPVPAVQLGFFLLKIVSAFQPCSPLAVNPWMFYPLLAVAALNLRAQSMTIQTVSLVLHFVAVSLSMRFSVLCLWHTPTMMFT